MFVRAYLRASSSDQNANRARHQLEAFAAERGLRIAAWYVENESGAKLARPELFRLLADSQPNDIALVEAVDRLSRLTAADWEKLKSEIATRKLRIVALDLPTSWMMAKEGVDDFTARMFEAINGMLLDTLAAISRKDYEDRRRRAAQGVARAQSEGRYRGALKTPIETAASPPCSPRASPGHRYRRRQVVAAQRWRRSPSVRCELRKTLLFKRDGCDGGIVELDRLSDQT